MLFAKALNGVAFGGLDAAGEFVEADASSWGGDGIKLPPVVLELPDVGTGDGKAVLPDLLSPLPSVFGKGVETGKNEPLRVA